jgi:hypothetical protein
MLFESVMGASRATRGKWGIGLLGWLGLAASCLGTDVTLSWKRSTDPNAIGYNVYYGVRSGQYTNMVMAGSADNVTVAGLVPGLSYYCAATSYDALGQEGVFSAETSFTVPLPPAPVLPDQSDRSIVGLTSMRVTNTATGSVPTYVFTYRLLNPPQGAVIDSRGIISWTPSLEQIPSTNRIITVVTDSGAVPQSATNEFTVVVLDGGRPRLSGSALVEQRFSVNVATELGRVYYLEVTETLDPPAWRSLAPVFGDGTVKTLIDPGAVGPVQFYRVRVE